MGTRLSCRRHRDCQEFSCGGCSLPNRTFQNAAYASRADLPLCEEAQDIEPSLEGSPVYATPQKADFERNLQSLSERGIREAHTARLKIVSDAVMRGLFHLQAGAFLPSSEFLAGEMKRHKPRSATRRRLPRRGLSRRSQTFSERISPWQGAETPRFRSRGRT